MTDISEYICGVSGSVYVYEDVWLISLSTCAAYVIQYMGMKNATGPRKRLMLSLGGEIIMGQRRNWHVLTVAVEAQTRSIVAPRGELNNKQTILKNSMLVEIRWFQRWRCIITPLIKLFIQRSLSTDGLSGRQCINICHEIIVIRRRRKTTFTLSLTLSTENHRSTNWQLQTWLVLKHVIMRWLDTLTFGKVLTEKHDRILGNHESWLHSLTSTAIMS